MAGTYSFTHYYDRGLIGSGTYRFRKFSIVTPIPANTLWTSDNKIFLTSDGKYFVTANN